MLSHLESLGDFDPQDFFLDVRNSDVLKLGIPQIVKLWPLHFSHPFVFLNLPPVRKLSTFSSVRNFRVRHVGPQRDAIECLRAGAGRVRKTQSWNCGREGPEPEGRMVTNEHFFNCLRFFSVFFADFGISWMLCGCRTNWTKCGMCFYYTAQPKRGQVGNGNMGKTWALPTSSPCVSSLLCAT